MKKDLNELEDEYIKAKVGYTFNVTTSIGSLKAVARLLMNEQLTLTDFPPNDVFENKRANCLCFASQLLFAATILEMLYPIEYRGITKGIE